MCIERINKVEVFSDGDFVADYENGIYTVLFKSKPLALKLNADWYFNIDMSQEEHGINFLRLNKQTIPDVEGNVFLCALETLNMIIER